MKDNDIKSYHGIEIANHRELAKALRVTPQAIYGMANKRKKFLLRLGLAYKKSLDSIKGGEEFSLDSLK